ncbi:two-component system response regulator [Porphyromonas sp. HMSC077F02]|uniref:response regulator transcription factor RprY n=1 Tax=Porphyromonas sp. HMSC077F02 TaxID=1739529 RepID=UPI0008A211E4|nr:response regulator transcription factor [Porphyromonas sp. HMSC077F02]OFO56945.1 two-component system response regulator [Porphyromonas sp. HMSC077F02]
MEDVVRVFLCEDDENLGPLLSEFLNTKGYQTDLFQDGQAGWEAFEEQPDHWNICVLDVMMPKMDGFELAQKIKSKNESLPIIFLTAKTLSEDVEQGFKLGADDYLKKPFNTAELTMRIDAVLRRVQGKKPEPVAFYNIGDFVFDTQKQMLTFRDEEPKRLTTKETDLLTLLCMHANDLMERNYALKTIWGEDSYFNARSMDVYITKLRKHLAQDERVEIQNKHGKGYKLITPNANSVQTEENTETI